MDMNLHEEEDNEANLFAMELLMPEGFVRREVTKMRHFDICNDKHMKAMADKFKVSQSVMAIRFGQLYK
jgi:Zn-dependent peptidase ImmA (M78 family)